MQSGAECEQAAAVHGWVKDIYGPVAIADTAAMATGCTSHAFTMDLSFNTYAQAAWPNTSTPWGI